MGADIPESTLVGWCGRAMKTLLPLIERIDADIMGSDLLHADDTPIRVLDRSRRDKGLGKGVKKAGSGPMCVTSGHGLGHHHRVLSIGLHQTGERNTLATIWQMPAVFCKQMVIRVMLSFTRLELTVYPLCVKRPVGRT